jgi:hypothetical protein
LTEQSHVLQILSALGCTQPPLSAEPFIREEDGTAYNVWGVQFPDSIRVLKIAKGSEAEIYAHILGPKQPFAPCIYAAGIADGTQYLLMEYIPGENLMHCTREKLIFALDALSEMQSEFWQNTAHSQIGLSFEDSISRRENRIKYLNDPELEQIYREFLREYRSVPRTLCHDDLLPFNVIIRKNRAVFIDWEVAGILPYPVSLARLIAHGEEGDGAFFFMTEEDKVFALDYYYQNLISQKGISREVYDRTMALFLFYELCEWIYLGNRYEDTDSVRFKCYLKKAKAMAKLF